jgi:hypothetical protein
VYNNFQINLFYSNKFIKNNILLKCRIFQISKSVKMIGDYSIFLFHILFVGPMLVAIGLYHDHPNFPKIIWQLLVILGIGIMGYHSWMAYNRYKALNS